MNDKDISNISDLIEGELNSNINKYIITPDNGIDKLRFGDVLLKLNASLFAEELKSRIKNDENESENFQSKI